MKQRKCSCPSHHLLLKKGIYTAKNALVFFLSILTVCAFLNIATCRDGEKKKKKKKRKRKDTEPEEDREEVESQSVESTTPKKRKRQRLSEN